MDILDLVKEKDEYIILKFTQKQYEELLMVAERRDYVGVETLLQDIIISEFYLDE